MKNVVLSLLVFVFITSCKDAPTTGFTLNGEAQGVFNGVRVYLNEINERGAPVPIDTAMVMNESFSFEGELDSPELMYITVNGVPGRLPLMIENGQLNLSIDNKILANSEFTGSSSHKVYKEFNDELKRLKDNINNANENLRNSNFLRDTVKMKSDKIVFDKANAEFEEFRYQYIADNSNSFAVLPIFKSVLTTRNADYARLVELFEKFDESIKNSEEGNALKPTLDQLKISLEAEKATAIGEVAPNFSAPNPNGENIALSDVVKKGKVTIIDFWAAWCGPCRRENPNVVKIYEKYHDKGLEIIGVGLDGRRGQQNPKDAWIKAIENDKLTWHQVSNLQYFDEIAQMYNVRSIPSMFVLDSEGKIIDKNLRGIALEKRIAQLLD